jgi:hypothetical protein
VQKVESVADAPVMWHAHVEADMEKSGRPSLVASGEMNEYPAVKFSAATLVRSQRGYNWPEFESKVTKE